MCWNLLVVCTFRERDGGEAYLTRHGWLLQKQMRIVPKNRICLSKMEIHVWTLSTGMLELSNRRHGLAIDFRIRTEDPRSARS